MARSRGAATCLIARKQCAARLAAITHKKRERQRKIRLVAALACTVAEFTASLFLTAPEPIPMHTSLLTGHKWLTKLLSGHPTRFREQLGMAKHAFYRLSFEL
ncbi:hypothetical protein B0H17DRAFT_927791 [Mycena rosella]|uniref:DUF8040 domain-containing protein n=1 Tax=Mycena rosella TaxID=1033263 RepID=A0AAD7GJU4_MYCRO|nr:hypothetical protein B0H17DRAFT_927791 [Mycena rosella]